MILIDDQPIFDELYDLLQTQSQEKGGFAHLKKLKELVIGSGDTSFRADTRGIWLGAANFSDAPFKVNMDGVITCSAIAITGGTIDGIILTGIASGSEIAIQGWQQDIAFSSTDSDTVAWTSGTITLLDGTTYSIDSGNTGNISALTYIYLDNGTSSTVLQTSTTASDAVGSGKILIAVAENSDTEAIFQVFGGKGGLKVRGGGVNDTFLKSPSATGETENDWTNPTNAYLSNDVYAIETIFSQKQDYYNFSFSVPAGATINGIEVKVEGNDNGGNNAETTMKLSYDGGTNFSNEKSQTFISGTDATKTFGGAADTWGRTWLSTEFSNANFRLIIWLSTSGAQLNVDHIQVKVHYSTVVSSIEKNSIIAANISANTITANEISANTITANEITGSTLSAIYADLGTITAGSLTAVTITASTITGNTIKSSSGNDRIELTSGDALLIYDSGTIVMQMTNSGIAWSAGATPTWFQKLLDNELIIEAYGSDPTVRFNFNSSNYFYPFNPAYLGIASKRWERIYCNYVGNNWLPSTAGSHHLGNPTYYWSDVSYKTLTDRGCLGVFDKGVELQDGRKVSSIEALKEIKKHPTKKTTYGVPRFDYKTMPKAVYKKADDEGKFLPRDKDDRPYQIDKKTKKKIYAEDGAELTALVSIMIGAIREIADEIKQLKDEKIENK